MQDQQLRHQYLHAMGVTSWLPRTQMAGAKESDPWVFEFLYGEVDIKSALVDETDESVSHEQNDTSKKRSRPVLPRFSEGLSKAESGKVEGPASLQKTAIKPVEVPVAKSSAVSETQLPKVELKPPTHKITKPPRFLLNFWAFDQVLIVDSLPAQGYGRVPAQAYRKLAINLVRAMGSKGENAKEIPSLGWPMLAGATLDQGVERAQEAVEYKLSKVLNDDYQPQVVLLLGESAVQMVMKRDETLDSLKGLPFSYSSKTKALASLSLTQMLQIPDCKREVWQDLQKVLLLEC